MTAPDVEQIVDELKRRVAERRAAGDYPIGLEAELESEFKAILAITHRGTDQIKVLRDRIELIEGSLKKVSGRTPNRSRFPGGRIFHRAIAKVTRRQVVGLASQTRDALHEVLAMLVSVVDQLEDQRLSDERAMNKLANAVLDRIVVVDQLAAAVVDLERRLDDERAERRS
jgi:hypothetical protein